MLGGILTQWLIQSPRVLNTVDALTHDWGPPRRRIVTGARYHAPDRMTIRRDGK